MLLFLPLPARLFFSPPSGFASSFAPVFNRQRPSYPLLFAAGALLFFPCLAFRILIFVPSGTAYPPGVINPRLLPLSIPYDLTQNPFAEPAETCTFLMRFTVAAASPARIRRLFAMKNGCDCTPTIAPSPVFAVIEIGTVKPVRIAGSRLSRSLPTPLPPFCCRGSSAGLPS